MKFLLWGVLCLVLRPTAVAGAYVFCADEGKTCSCTGTVQYGSKGTNQLTAPKVVTGSIQCNNGVFGDVAPGIVKTCMCQEGTSAPVAGDYKKCANEGQTCSCTGTVQYGNQDTNQLSVPKAVTGSVQCTNKVFSDVAPGVSKICLCKAGTTGNPGNSGKCCTNMDCAAPNPICQPNGQCSNRRVIEPISRLPMKYFKQIRTRLDNKLWEGVKFVRGIIPVVGMDERVNDAALMEVAYFVDNLLYNGGQKQGHSDLVPGLLKDEFATLIQVFPRCPFGWTKWGENYVAIGGATTFHARVNEEWVMRYPKCTLNQRCNDVGNNVLCTQCGNHNAGPLACNDTLAHEFGHTLARAYGKIKGDRNLAKETWGEIQHYSEYAAWGASQWFQNPGDESGRGRNRGNPMSDKQRDFFQKTMGFNKNLGWRYELKHRRCPNKGVSQPCDDSLTRTVRLPLDDETAHPPRERTCMSHFNPTVKVASFSIDEAPVNTDPLTEDPNSVFDGENNAGDGDDIDDVNSAPALAWGLCLFLPLVLQC